MMLERVEYFWGLFDDPWKKLVPRQHGLILPVEAADIPKDVAESFQKEAVGKLVGEFGLPGAGDPTEVDVLTFTVDGKESSVRVLNRGISMFTAKSAELARLHRFFSVLPRK